MAHRSHDLQIITDHFGYGWEGVAEALEHTVGIAYDGCHKIYLLLDQGQLASFRDLRYGLDDDNSELIEVSGTEESRRQALDTLRRWWVASCGLRFVQGFATGPAEQLQLHRFIAQGE